jgi:hypothetical protein
MTVTFIDNLPADLHRPPIIISGDESLELNGRQYLMAQDEGLFFEIRYEYSCGPFKGAVVVNNLLAVGYGEYFYLFDLGIKNNILRLKIEGYFGDIHVDNNLFYITDAYGMHCVSTAADIIWHNSFAADGVIIDDFTEPEITGSYQYDPPDGWSDFVLNKQTGVLQ